MNTLLNLLNISVAEAVRFELEVNYSRGTSSFNAELDKQYGLNPKADQWFSADYRNKFIANAVVKMARQSPFRVGGFPD